MYRCYRSLLAADSPMPLVLPRKPHILTGAERSAVVSCGSCTWNIRSIVATANGACADGERYSGRPAVQGLGVYARGA